MVAVEVFAQLVFPTFVFDHVIDHVVAGHVTPICDPVWSDSLSAVDSIVCECIHPSLCIIFNLILCY